MNSNLSPNQRRSGMLALPGGRNGNTFAKQTKRLTSKELEERRAFASGVKRNLCQDTNAIEDS